jgi:hypothetical protein
LAAEGCKRGAWGPYAIESCSLCVCVCVCSSSGSTALIRHTLPCVCVCVCVCILPCVCVSRYMGTPADNAEGYRQSSVLTHAAAMNGKLLLVHGQVRVYACVRVLT